MSVRVYSISIALLVLALAGLMTAIQARLASDPLPQGFGSVRGGQPPALPVVGYPADIATTANALVLNQDVLAINTARPNSSSPNPSAKAFRSSLFEVDRSRAITCLAVAAVYEAGAKQSDQQAVMQVILNRVRHPAYPKTICGVVFQGGERSTGCQFTFACDGSMLRWKPTAVTLRRARTLASAMLDYRVDARVGLATHYHTNRVLPNWSMKLDKITSVETHIFLRWNGYWGQPGAFRGRHNGMEPAISRLSTFDPNHALAARDDDITVALPAEATLEAVQETPSSAALVAMSKTPSLIRVASLQPLNQPGRWALDAVRQCGGQAECRVVGWQDPNQTPAELTAASLTSSPPDFMYIQILRNRVQQAYWDCKIWPKSATGRCIGNPGDLLHSLGMFTD